MYSKKFKTDYGKIVNCFIGAIGIICILLGIISYCYNIISTILLSVGTSILATSIVTWINAKYMLKSQHVEKLMSKWKICNLYKTKADMNTLDANIALEQCSEAIDIIAEGLSNYRAAQGDTLKNKILNHNVKVRIISCDSSEMLKQRAQDESSSGIDDGKSARQKVKELKQWVEQLHKELDDKSNLIQIRYHNSYPGVSYLRIDNNIFVSVNLWKKQSQQSFAIGFAADGEGGEYFQDYFENLWTSDFVHEECQLLKEKDKNGI